MKSIAERIVGGFDQGHGRTQGMTPCFYEMRRAIEELKQLPHDDFESAVGEIINAARGSRYDPERGFTTATSAASGPATRTR